MEWNEQVWDLVTVIPAGRVATYGQLAAMLGHPRRSRHVGFALKQTPESRQLPWHRVINSKGEISFPLYSEGYHVQRALLESEGIVFAESGRISLRKYRWDPLNS